MSKDSQRPAHSSSLSDPTDPVASAHPQDPSASESPTPSSFFLQERERLIADIAESLGEIMTNTNALNRKIEESVLVGKEFEPVAQLWGRFAAMMGAPESINMTMDGAAAQQQQQQQQQQEQASAAAVPGGDPAASTNTLAASRSDKPGQQAQAQPQTFDVAPGGGTWSAKGHSQR